MVPSNDYARSCVPALFSVIVPAGVLLFLAYDAWFGIPTIDGHRYIQSEGLYHAAIVTNPYLACISLVVALLVLRAGAGSLASGRPLTHYVSKQFLLSFEWRLFSK